LPSLYSTPLAGTYIALQRLVSRRDVLSFQHLTPTKFIERARSRYDARALAEFGCSHRTRKRHMPAAEVPAVSHN
jgi:hypothetical protein